MSDTALLRSQGTGAVGTHLRMHLHDYFAAKAMAAFIDIQGYGSGNLDYSNIAKDAYLLADAMIKIRAER